MEYTLWAVKCLSGIPSLQVPLTSLVVELVCVLKALLVKPQTQWSPRQVSVMRIATWTLSNSTNTLASFVSSEVCICILILVKSTLLLSLLSLRTLLSPFLLY